MNPNQETILKVVIGSQAHGLATPDSDFDYRGVFVVPTQDILSVGARIHSTSWIEGKDDDTSWEIGHFLHLATKCNPTILETFLAPVVEQNEFGAKLQALFPHVWNSKAVLDAFTGYGFNQRKKFLEDKDKRPSKYACAYFRTLYHARELLTTGTFTIRIADTPIGPMLKEWKAGHWSAGEVIQTCMDMEVAVRNAYEVSPKKETNIEAVNEFLLEVREAYWK